MLVKPANPIVNASGRCSGVSFHRDSSGLHLSAMHKPRNPNTSDQRHVRSAFAICRRLWSASVTPQQRDRWHIFAALHPFRNRLGDPTPLSGWHWFCRVNMLRLLTECPITLEAPRE